jgi:hypothetical protein
LQRLRLLHYSPVSHRRAIVGTREDKIVIASDKVGKITVGTKRTGMIADRAMKPGIATGIMAGVMASTAGRRHRIIGITIANTKAMVTPQAVGHTLLQVRNSLSACLCISRLTMA